MRIKSYYAKTVQLAMDQARKEMGPDAMLIHSRRTLPDARQYGDYEVVFGTLQENVAAPAAPAAPPASVAQAPITPAPVVAAPTAKAAAADPALEDIRAQIRDLHRQLLGTRTPPPEVQEALVDEPSILTFLRDEELSDSLAAELHQAVQTRLTERSASIDAPNTRAALKLELDRRIEFEPRPVSSCLALIGPPGAGKTINLVKLAIQFGVNAGRPVQLVSFDTEKVGGAEQLESYARIMGVRFRRAHSIEDLDLIKAESRGDELVLIDTPGFSYADLEAAEPLARALKARRHIDLHLTLPATMRTRDLTSLANAFSSFGARKLLFTRLDETGCMGPLVNLAVSSGLVLSHFSTGQQIPESLTPASTDFICANLYAGRKATRHAA